MVTSISLTGSGAGGLHGISGAGGGGSSSGATIVTYTGNGTTPMYGNGTSMPNIGTISMPSTTIYPSTVSLGSGVYSVTSNPGVTSIDGDITLTRPNGRMNVGKTLEMILEHLNLIVPIDSELDSNPSLKAAYENYLEVLAAARNQTVKDAFDSYQTIRKLSKDDND